MLVGLVALMAAAAEARLAWMPAAVPVQSGRQIRGAARHAGPWLKEEGQQTVDAGYQASRSMDLMEKIMGKLSNYSETMWSPPWLEEAQTTAKAELETAVLDAELQLQRAQLESERACARVAEFEAQLARTEEGLESTKRELEEACRNARDQVASLDDALEVAEEKLAKVQLEKLAKVQEAQNYRRAADFECQEAAKARQDLAKTRAELDQQRTEAAEVSIERDAMNTERDAALTERDAALTERDAALTRVAELEAALAEAQLSKRVRMQRFLSRLNQRLHRK